MNASCSPLTPGPIRGLTSPARLSLLPTLAWKDYKEQRAIWLAIAMFAVLLSLGTAYLAKGGIAGVHNDRVFVGTIRGMLLVLMIAQGTVCGAQLFAGENDAGSLPFLDALSSRRTPIWLTKLAVGTVFTLLQTFVVVAIILFLRAGLRDQTIAPWYAVVGWLALLWGMVAGAVCERVFPAILLGIALMIANFALLVVIPLRRELVQIALAGVPLVLSYRIFCAADLDRRLKDRESKKRPQRVPYRWQTLLWLAERQGRWIVWPGLVVSLVAGFVLWRDIDFVWPLVTAIIGLVCGLAVFAPEQNSEQDRFLAAQRLPPGRVWLVKTLFWVLAAAGMTGLYYLGLYYRFALEKNVMDRPFLLGALCPDGNFTLYIVEWVSYGFACGQCAALLARRIVVAGFVAVALTVLLLIWWLPSLLFGGIRDWQILTVPVFLLAAARLGMWIWFSGRLYTRRHWLLLMGCALAIALWVGANLWHRAVEIPDVGEPFDLQAFDAKLNKAARSEANVMMQRGLERMEAQVNKVDDELGFPTKPLFPVDAKRPATQFNGIDRNYLAACNEILVKGWPPQDDEINRWLDALFAGNWAQEFRAASTMPLGLPVDPRTLHLNDVANNKHTQEFIYKGLSGYATAGDLLAVRSLQLMARGEDQAALDQLKVLPGLSRQVRHCLPASVGLSRAAAAMDRITLHPVDYFVQKIGAKPALLRQVLDLLQDQEKQALDPSDFIKAYYVVVQNHPTWSWGQLDGSPYGAILQLALQTPWEGERQTRFTNALYQGTLRSKKRDYHGLALRFGLTLTDSKWTAARWDQLIKSDWNFRRWPWFGELDNRNFDRELRIRQLEIALMLYQIDAGHAAANLDDLLPRYLAKVPLDPVNEESFNYKVSKGEEVKGWFANVGGRGDSLRLLPGQGALWLDEDGAPEKAWYPVPVINKK